MIVGDVLSLSSELCYTRKGLGAVSSTKMLACPPITVVTSNTLESRKVMFIHASIVLFP